VHRVGPEFIAEKVLCFSLVHQLVDFDDVFAGDESLLDGLRRAQSLVASEGVRSGMAATCRELGRAAASEEAFKAARTCLEQSGMHFRSVWKE